jgi:hypothetical protein
MVATRAQKRCVADSKNPLQHTGILQRVLDYVGSGHWCFVAEVSSLWRALYARVADKETQKVTDLWSTMVCVPRMTLLSAVFASLSRVSFALAQGLRCSAKLFQRAAGMYADIPTLRAVHQSGVLQYTDVLMEGALRCNQLAVVQFLRAEGCPWGLDTYCAAATRGHTDLCAYLYAAQCPRDAGTAACDCAAMNGHASTLRWLREYDFPWQADGLPLLAARGDSVDTMVALQQLGIVYDAEMLSDMLNVAGVHNKLVVAKWLRQQGAEWPGVLQWTEAWSGDALAWARAEGCTSPTEHYDSDEE